MSSSYSSLDCVLSQWAHFTVRILICVPVFVFCVFVLYCIVVVLLQHGGVNLVALKSNP